MPMLDFKCGKCNKVYEILTEKDEKKCPECGDVEQQSIIPPSCGRPVIH